MCMGKKHGKTGMHITALTDRSVTYQGCHSSAFFKGCVSYLFFFLPNDSPSKAMKNAFYFI